MSTPLLEFQRLYTPTAFREERIHWRAIIQLNLIRSVHTILSALASTRHKHKHSGCSIGGPRTIDSGWDEYSHLTNEPPMLDTDFSVPPSNPTAHGLLDNVDLDSLTTRLLPLRHAEAFLKAKLVPPSEDEPADLGHGPVKEIYVRPGRWRASLTRLARPLSAGTTGIETPDEPQRILYECRDDLHMLWHSLQVREVLAIKRVRLEEESGLYVGLNCVVLFLLC